MSTTTDKAVVPPPKCGRWDVDNDTYHADRTALSGSVLNCYRESPELYGAMYVEETEPKKDPTKDMEIGSAFHVFTLEHKDFDDLYAFEPTMPDGSKLDKRTKAAKAILDEWVPANEGKIHLSSDWKEKFERMKQQCMDNDEVREILLHPDAEFEVSIRFMCQGVQCKSRFDILIETEDVVTNLKTSKDYLWEDIRREILNRDYHMSAALYEHGYEQVFGRPLVASKQIWCHKTPMYESTCTKVGPKSMEIGRDIRDETLLAMRSSLQMDHYRSPHWGVCDEIEIPDWALRRHGM